ncbi:AVR4 protein, partial [Anhinga rufa]|nr:AVR4 protein [Anhinga rufa]
QCQISGLWRNKQDSLMEILAMRDDRDFQGKYFTWITLTSGCACTSSLKDIQQQPGKGGRPTFAFTVHWDNGSPDATTAFIGQCFVDAAGNEMLTTMWLLCEAAGSLKAD